MGWDRAPWSPATDSVSLSTSNGILYLLFRRQQHQYPRTSTITNAAIAATPPPIAKYNQFFWKKSLDIVVRTSNRTRDKRQKNRLTHCHVVRPRPAAGRKFCRVIPSANWLLMAQCRTITNAVLWVQKFAMSVFLSKDIHLLLQMTVVRDRKRHWEFVNRYLCSTWHTYPTKELPRCALTSYKYGWRHKVWNRN